MSDSATPGKGGVPVLSLRDIHMAFGGVVAVENFNLDIEAGEIVALVGDNGAGKSTLVKIIAGVHQPTSGQMLVDGREVTMKTRATRRRSAFRSSTRTSRSPTASPST